MDATRAPVRYGIPPPNHSSTLSFGHYSCILFVPSCNLRTCLGCLPHPIKPLGVICHCNWKNDPPIEIGHIVYVP